MTILFRDACPFSHFIVQFLEAGGALKTNIREQRLGWKTENVTITSSAFPKEYLSWVKKVWPSASVIQETVSMYSEGPLVRGFLSTQLSPSSRGNLDKDLPVIMMFGW
jgi:Na+-transporting NADH:ubiquinone oxidoreductase subunit NqrA